MKSPSRLAAICFFVLVTLPALVTISCGEKTAGETKTAKDISPEFLVTENSLGPLRMGMTVEEVERALGKDIELLNTNPEEVWVDSAKITYEGEPVTFYFDRQYQEDDSYTLVLGSIRMNSPKFRTSAGIGVGSGKEEIWDRYKDGYAFTMYADYEDTSYTVRSKTRYFINVSEGEGEFLLMFYLDSNKVKSVEITRNYPEGG